MIKFKNYRIIKNVEDFVANGFENEHINQVDGKIDFHDNNNYPLALVYITDWFGCGYFIISLDEVKNEIKKYCEEKINQCKETLNCIKNI